MTPSFRPSTPDEAPRQPAKKTKVSKARQATTVKHLPAWVMEGNKWPEENPFAYHCDTVLIAAVQESVDAVFPGNMYKATLCLDPIFEQLAQCMNGGYNQIGSAAFDVIKEFFCNDPAYCDKPTAMAGYARWALESMGPLIYRKPSPPGTVPNVEGTWTKPNRLFESPFIIKMMTKVFSMISGSCGLFSIPVGGLAMAATALKHAFLVYMKCEGVVPKVLPNAFSDNKHWNWLKEQCGVVENAKKAGAPVFYEPEEQFVA
uniref:Uncharacterized protein n=1 Tax=Moniliophthora roreri TaxID=221103 RepID=A0A0W0G1B6_MONRR